VGGFVRDALLEKPINDFDIVIEGDATKLGRALVQRFGGRVTVHAPFKTATWFVPETFNFQPSTLDLISARSETYARPAALPTIKLGALTDDLRRRDFTINAMAVRLDADHFGELTDPLGGRADLERGLVRVLHPNSFVDDPTRLFRAVRYAARYGFKIESETEASIPSALKYVDELSPERLRHELDLILEEDDAVPMLEKLWALGIAQAARPALPSDEATRGRIQRAVKVPSAVGSRVHFRWAVWLMGLPLKEIRALSKRLHFSAELLKKASAAASVFADLEALASLRPSGCVRRLDGAPEDALWAVAVCAAGEARAKLENYLSAWRSMKPHTNGETLEELGVPFGPIRGDILRKLRAAWLDGELTSEEGEREMLRKMVGEEKMKEER
jgi:tRNA nucleotidyltransferase (CCA-adding enzyme)